MIDWDDAPEGATHAYEGLWYKVNAQSAAMVFMPPRDKWVHSIAIGNGERSIDDLIPRPAKPAEWPEIGEHCETTWGEKQNWFECVRLPHEALALYKYGDWTIAHVHRDYIFRPIFTKEQREREELNKIIGMAVYEEHDDTYFNRIADAILAAGYRKQERN